MRKLIFLIAVLFLGTFESCVSVQADRYAPETTVFFPSINIKGETCAVLAGNSKTYELVYANALTQSLQLASDLKILDQAKIKEACPAYPVKIKGPFGLAYFDVDIDYSKTDLAAIEELRKRIKANYIIVVWIPTSVKTDSTVYCTGVFQMFHFPEVKEIARGKVNLFYNEPGSLKEEDLFREIYTSFKNSSDRVAKDLSRKLKIVKPFTVPSQ